MQAFVTGANGFTGSHLVKALINQGHTVTGLVRSSSNLSRLQGIPIDLIYGDITDQNLLENALQNVDTLFHTAAYVELGLVDETEMERVNVKGTHTLLKVAQSVGIFKMVYCSTIGIYGDTQGQIVDETFQRTQRHFSSAYDRTKYQGQQLVDQFFRQGLPVVSVMPSGIFGMDDPHFGPVIQLFLQQKLKFWVGGDRITGIVHVDDLVEGMILAAEKSPPGEHYILSGGELKTRDMFTLLSQETNITPPQDVPEPLVRLGGNILEVFGKLFPWNPPLSRERVHYLYDRCVRVDGSKACRELGWKPRSIPATLRSLIPEEIISL